MVDHGIANYMNTVLSKYSEIRGSYMHRALSLGESKTWKSENTEAQNGYLKGHILKSTQSRIKI